jgi:Ni,Fe-hydrogenase I small subunit
MAILGAEGPGKDGHNLPDFLQANNVQLLWHPSLSLESPSEIKGMLERIIARDQPLTFLCVEGSIIHGPNGTGMFDTFDGIAKKDLIEVLCNRAEFVLAMGTCAAYGGIPAAAPNPTDSSGLQYLGDVPGGLLGADWRSKSGLPVVNLAGCPVDAATMLKTLSGLLDRLPVELDDYQRPSTVNPCLSHPEAVNKKCGTSDQVGYACYGCISARFPFPKSLFRHVDRIHKRPSLPVVVGG